MRHLKTWGRGSLGQSTLNSSGVELGAIVDLHQLYLKKIFIYTIAYHHVGVIGTAFWVWTCGLLLLPHYVADIFKNHKKSLNVKSAVAMYTYLNQLI